MSAPQPNALAAITAALTGGKPAAPPVVNPATLPMQQAPFAFTPQAPAPAAAAVPNPQVFTPTANVPVTPNPFQPSPVQAAAMFAAAVPQAAQTHAHPSTGVPFAPINPPGEAASAPTVGLDAAPVPPGPDPRFDFGGGFVGGALPASTTPEAPADPAPKAPRRSMPRTTKGDEAPQLAGNRNCDIGLNNLPAGDGAAANAEASAAPSFSLWDCSVTDLADELSRRGWKITLSR